MRVIVLSVLAYVALGLTFNVHTNCASLEAACDGDAACATQDVYIAAGMNAEGMDVSAITTWDATNTPALVRYAYRFGWDLGTQFAINDKLEPVLRCTVEQSGLTWSMFTACYDEIGSCVADPTCFTMYDTYMNVSASMGTPTVYINRGLQTIGITQGEFLPISSWTPYNGLPYTPMTNEQVAPFFASFDMSNNGKLLAIASCMVKDWMAMDIQTVLDDSEPCYHMGIKCFEDADCPTASQDVADCAADKDITMEPHWLLGSIMQLPADASHEDYCEVATCSAENGNSLYMSLGSCMMDANDYAYTKCYDDMVAKFVMLLGLVGGGAWAGGVLMFFLGWCMCCRNSNKAQVTNV